MKEITFDVEEAKKISEITACICDRSLTLCEFTEQFMQKLKSLIYYDKSDFMFFRYNESSGRYEMESFRPVNWSNKEIHDYIDTYMHNDDVLPILSQPEFVAFRNSDLFSLKDRRETDYFKNFAAAASLEISIDANIPLPEDCDVIAIMGFFRSLEKVEFSEKDLAIIKLLQPHLSERMKLDVCNSVCLGSGGCDGKRLCRELSEQSQNTMGEFELNNIDTLGICACDPDGSILSSNVSFTNFTNGYSNEGNSDDNPLISSVRDSVRTLVSSDFFSLGPRPIHIGDDTYMLQLAYNDSAKNRITVAIYYTSDLFTKRLEALQQEYSLSNREFEIIFLSLKRSLTNAEIANQLFISETTVKRHLYSVYQKVGVSNQKQLFRKLQIV